jgi:hypothetical protein
MNYKEKNYEIQHRRGSSVGDVIGTFSTHAEAACWIATMRSVGMKSNCGIKINNTNFVIVKKNR